MVIVAVLVKVAEVILPYLHTMLYTSKVLPHIYPTGPGLDGISMQYSDCFVYDYILV